MKREIVFSIALHLVALVLVVWAPSLGSSKPFDPGQVIQVRAIDMPAFEPGPPPPPAKAEPEPIEPVKAPPKTTVEEPEEIPISDPSTEAKPKEVPKPKPKPEPEKAKPKPQQADTETKPSGTDDAAASGTGETEIASTETGSGSPFAGATVDNASFDYPYWFDQAFTKIARNYHPRFVVDAELICVVSFKVIKSGRVFDVKLLESSGLPVFDETCTAAIDQASPFPPLPQQFRAEVIGITIPFKYEPR